MPIGDKIHNIEINDSEFERIGWQNARYRGTKLTSAKINEYNRGDITFGLKPVIEQYSRTVYVFNQVENSFESLSGLFYPSTDEHFQSLPDKIIVGSAQFKIDRAVTFELDDPADNSQIQPGIDGNDPSFYYFDTLMKTDLIGVTDLGAGITNKLMDLVDYFKVSCDKFVLGNEFERLDNKADNTLLNNLGWLPEINLYNYIEENRNVN